ncbi:MAG: hypothetical protein K6L81_17465 [Agarilytica sp.]
MSHYKFYLPHDLSFSIDREFAQSVTFYDQSNTRRMHISHDGKITVYKGYSWDGCSPKISVFDWVYLGTPDGTIKITTGQPMTYLASLFHDALYQFLDHPHMPLKRKEMDDIFLSLMTQSRFSLRWPYYIAVRALGGVFHYVMKGIRKLSRH